MGIVHIDKCRYEIQEQKEFPVWYTGVYRPIKSTVTNSIFTNHYIIRRYITQIYESFVK
jgi:hypothetical protein